jgi:hypothetical protein
MKPIYCSLVFLITALMTQNASAVVLNVNGSGILTGAQNVDVAGVLYDVEFKDNGSFSDIFSVPPAYDVLDSNSALIFSMALMQRCSWMILKERLILTPALSEVANLPLQMPA